MNDNSKFFRVIWKINAVIFLVFGLLALGTLFYSSYRIIQEVFRDREVPSMVNVEPDPGVKSEWTLGDFDRLDGTDYLIAPVHSTQTYQASYYEKGTSAVRNYLFVNGLDKSSRWLVPHNSYLFLSKHEGLIYPSTGERYVDWIRYEVIKEDTNRDERMTRDDQRTIAISYPTGEGYLELLSGIDQVLGYEMRDANHLLIFYLTDGTNYLSEIDIANRLVTVTEELPKIEP
jgi:hypothetical protein